MASKNGTGKTKSEQSSVNSGDRKGFSHEFVKYRLSDEEILQGRSACEQFSDIAEIMCQMIDEGYKVSASRDGFGGGTQVFMTPSAKENPNAGWTLTARAPGIVLAVGMLAFKHYTLFAQVWPKGEADQRGSNWG